MRNIFNTNQVSMGQVRKVSSTSFPTVTLPYDECCKLLAQAVVSAHVTTKELKQMILGIKRVFNVDKVDIERYLPRYNSLNISRNALNCWKEEMQSIKSSLANMEWEI